MYLGGKGNTDQGLSLVTQAFYTYVEMRNRINSPVEEYNSRTTTEKSLSDGLEKEFASRSAARRYKTHF